MTQDILVKDGLSKKWLTGFESCNIIYTYSMFGYGKKFRAMRFAKNYYITNTFFDAKNSDFLQELKKQIELYNKSLNKKLIIINNIQVFKDNEKIRILLDLLLGNSRLNKSIKFLLLSDSDFENYLLPLKLANKIMVFGRDELLMSTDEIVELIKSYPSFAGLNNLEIKKLANKSFEFSNGFVTACIAYIIRLPQTTFNAQSAYNFAIDDLHNYFDIKLQEINFEHTELLTKLSVFNEFTMQAASEILTNEEMQTLQNTNNFSGFLYRKTPDIYSFEPNIYRYFLNKLTNTNLSKIEQTLTIAAKIHENNRDFKMALQCYKILKNNKKIAEIIVYLSEIADGCEFAIISSKYINDLPLELYKNNAGLLGAKALTEAYCLRKNGYDKYLNKLKELAVKEKKETTAQDAYVRTIIACPMGNAESLKENLLLFSDQIIKNNVKLRNIMPTGNMPSVLNGGLDLLNWVHINKIFYPALKKAVEIVIGFEAIGCFNIIMGEIFFEKSNKTEALNYLSKAKYEIEKSDNLRTEYAATAILANVLLTENKANNSYMILEQFHKKAKEAKFKELLPNIEASLALISLYQGNCSYCNDWLARFAPNEYGEFYFTYRYELLIKTKVYIMQDRNLDALYILNLLEQYAVECERNYLIIQINLLRAIIFNSLNEPWENYFLKSINKAYEYGIIQVIANEGVLALNLFRKINWKNYDIKPSYIKKVKDELKIMAKNYPRYLSGEQKNAQLTKKEKEVLYLIAKGYKNAQIAAELYINIGTVKFHVSNIMKKFKVDSRALIIKKAQEQNYI